MPNRLFAFLVLLLCSFTLHAAPLPPNEIKAMVAQIDAVMDSGLCAVASDNTDRGTETMTVILKGVGVRQILVNDYNWMRSANYQKTPDGRWLMSVQAEQACGIEALGGRCISYRTFFQRLFPDVRRPGTGVPIVRR